LTQARKRRLMASGFIIVLTLRKHIGKFGLLYGGALASKPTPLSAVLPPATTEEHTRTNEGKHKADDHVDADAAIGGVVANGVVELGRERLACLIPVVHQEAADTGKH